MKMQAVETTTTLKSVASSRLVRTLAAGSLAALLAGCATDAPQDTWQPKGPNAQMINDLDWVVFGIAGVVGAVVFSVVAFAL